eukprot:6368263-Pyramimonas_sp.AAC.1
METFALHHALGECLRAHSSLPDTLQLYRGRVTSCSITLTGDPGVGGPEGVSYKVVELVH